MNSNTSVFVANNNVDLAKELIISFSMQRKDYIHRARLASVVDDRNPRIWKEVLAIADTWGIEVVNE